VMVMVVVVVVYSMLAHHSIRPKWDRNKASRRDISRDCFLSIDSHLKGAGNDPRIYFVERLFSKIYTGSKLLAKKGLMGPKSILYIITYS
jgi:hypothetical protein